MTIKVKLLVSMASSRSAYAPGDAFPAGDEDEANRLVVAGYAVRFTAKELKDIEAREADAERARAAAAEALASSQAAADLAVETAVEPVVETPETAARSIETAVQDPPAETA